MRVRTDELAAGRCGLVDYGAAHVGVESNGAAKTLKYETQRSVAMEITIVRAGIIPIAWRIPVGRP